ncbi:hypothetical protein PUR71_29855 [Streptomyces sp. SP17BM10]|uniref:hypothetical protein n=1 Tax=Streptomyces sp. SP17BM10 TaxID=3002530 RepID=UPI002E75EC6B|nr:hypothetical protein [Streptomyces sp. SP17BM10]MEE1787079.1 hypothetical protein [Streptomyces sp. SP17BM10]
MDGRERDASAAMGCEPRQERGLDALASGLAFGLRSRAWEVMQGVRPRTVLALVLLSLGLLVAGLRTAPAFVVWAFAGCWGLMLASACAVLRACAADGGGGR